MIDIRTFCFWDDEPTLNSFQNVDYISISLFIYILRYLNHNQIISNHEVAQLKSIQIIHFYHIHNIKQQLDLFAFLCLASSRNCSIDDVGIKIHTSPVFNPTATRRFLSTEIQIISYNFNLEIISTFIPFVLEYSFIKSN